MNLKAITGILVVVLVAGLTAVAIGLSMHHTPTVPTTKRTSTPTSLTPTGTPSPSADGSTPTPAPTRQLQPGQDITHVSLGQPGSTLSAGATTNLPLLTAGGGNVAYAAVTVDAPKQLGRSAAAAARAAGAFPGTGAVYVMRVRVRFLGTVNKSTGGTVLDRANLLDFTIFNHPGSTPLTSSADVTTSGCPSLPAQLPALGGGQSLTWCVTAAAAAPDLTLAEGGQYATTSGPYLRPVSWMTTTASSPYP